MRHMRQKQSTSELCSGMDSAYALYSMDLSGQTIYQRRLGIILNSILYTAQPTTVDQLKDRTYPPAVKI